MRTRSRRPLALRSSARCRGEGSVSSPARICCPPNAVASTSSRCHPDASAHGVPVAAVADVDVLRVQVLLQRIVEASGGEWEFLETEWRTLSSAVAASVGPACPVRQLRVQLDDVPGDDPEASLARDQVTAVRQSRASRTDEARSGRGWRRGTAARRSYLCGTTPRRCFGRVSGCSSYRSVLSKMESGYRRMRSRSAGGALAEGVHRRTVELRGSSPRSRRSWLKISPPNLPGVEAHQIRLMAARGVQPLWA
jgi:hypothetical protein